MPGNLIPRALSERLPRADDKDVLDYLNRELIPLVRDIRTALNDSPVLLAEPRADPIDAPVDLATAIVAINEIRQVLIDRGLTE
jgi:hypothetical protein